MIYLFFVTLSDCDVETRQVPDEECRLERVQLPNERICTYTPRPETREVCQDVTMRAFAEECRQVPKLIPHCFRSFVNKSIVFTIKRMFGAGTRRGESGHKHESGDQIQHVFFSLCF